MKVLVTGAGGMLGTDVVAALLERGHDAWGLLRRRKGGKLRTRGGTKEGGDMVGLEITDPLAIKSVFSRFSPEVVINCAAYTAVDKAEKEKDRAFRVNSVGAGNLARACRGAGARFFHISTDFVFDGESKTPYTEDDQAAPLGVYGASKLAGEEQVKNNCDDYVIVRTSWVFGRGGGNFVKTILKKAAEVEVLRVVSDQVGSPTFTKDLAEAIVNLIGARAKGIFNFSNQGTTCWYEFALAIVEGARVRGAELKVRTVTPVKTSQFPTPAPRPAYSVLDTSKYVEVTGAAPPAWKDALGRFLDAELKTGEAR